MDARAPHSQPPLHASPARVAAEPLPEVAPHPRPGPVGQQRPQQRALQFGVATARVSGGEETEFAEALTGRIPKLSLPSGRAGQRRQRDEEELVQVQLADKAVDRKSTRL